MTKDRKLDDLAGLPLFDTASRAELERSRNRFLAFRDRCPSDACIADTYRGRMREIRDIVDEGGR